MNAYRLKPLSFPWPPVLYGLAILLALLADRFIGILPSVMPNGYLFYAIGALLVAVGVAMLTGAFSGMSYWLLETFPALATIG